MIMEEVKPVPCLNWKSNINYPAARSTRVRSRSLIPVSTNFAEIYPRNVDFLSNVYLSTQ